ncbi:hypothetical protein CEXT_273381 [Caerostris extrusa]|uniref:Uncharacterized protein n=1 Tax=Caerostris extrusa TaxID=172846 RepID=A0AAV4N5L8_CAEEX|nr:hypothetical protein CEXT_273381 [Caerostris extrusa]
MLLQTYHGNIYEPSPPIATPDLHTRYVTECRTIPTRPLRQTGRRGFICLQEVLWIFLLPSISFLSFGAVSVHGYLHLPLLRWMPEGVFRHHFQLFHTFVELSAHFFLSKICERSGCKFRYVIKLQL